MSGHDGAGVSATDSRGSAARRTPGGPVRLSGRGHEVRGVRRGTASGTPVRVGETPCRRSPRRVGRRRWRRDGSQRACGVRATAGTGACSHGEAYAGRASTLSYWLDRKASAGSRPDPVGRTPRLHALPDTESDRRPTPGSAADLRHLSFRDRIVHHSVTPLPGRPLGASIPITPIGKVGMPSACPRTPSRTFSNRPTPPDNVPEQST